MKKILLFVFLLIFLPYYSFGATADNVDNKLRQINFNNKLFVLKNSQKSITGGYLNEYYKNKEIGPNWTEMITVMSYPNSNATPLQFAQEIIKVQPELKDFEKPIAINQKKNEVTTLFFLVGQEKKYNYIEFNVIKISAYKTKNEKGLKSIQFIKKYKFTNDDSCSTAITKMKNNKLKYFNKILNIQMPAIVNESFTNW